MKYKFLFFFLILIINCKFYTQIRPESFYYFGDNNLYKTSAENPVSNSISDIVTIGNTVWLGTSRGVSVSLDRGESWTNFYNVGPFGDEGISAVAYNKYDGSIWVATATDTVDAGGEIIPKGAGLKYTLNNGATWTCLPQPVDKLEDTTEVYGINTLRAVPITATELNVTYDIVFTPGNIWITSYGSGTRRSTNMGQTWKRVVVPPDDLNSVGPNDTLDFCLSPKAGNYCSEENLNYIGFSVIAIDDTTLYVGTADGINKTTNAGDQYPSWVKFNHTNQDEPISGNFVTALAYNIYNNTIWASTWKANGETEFYAVSSSTDGGATWKIFLKDERPHNFGFKNSDIIAATDNGAFRSSNEGNSWILPNNIVDKNSGVALTTTEFYSAATEEDDVWLGSGDGLAKLIETGFWQGDWKIYFASLPLESINATYCYPNPFSPRLEDLKIKYTTNGESKKITIRIFDFAMNMVRTVIQNADRTKTLDDAPEKWDGKDENGKLVPNGVYFYRIDFDNDNPVFGKVIVLQ